MIKKEEVKYFSYPNPQFRRENFRILDCECDFFIYSNSDDSLVKKTKILIPYAYETPKSGVNDETMYQHVAYYMEFDIKKLNNYLLHFQAVDYECDVYINSHFVGNHIGGYTSFSFDVTKYLVEGKNTLVVDVRDSFSKAQLRGKQREVKESHECWYVQTTGIYKSIYLEECGTNHIEKAYFSGDKNGKVTYKIFTTSTDNLNVNISFKDELVKTFQLSGALNYEGTLTFEEYKLWKENEGNLYDVELILDGLKEDKVSTYFGFRTIETKGSNIYLNDEKVFLRLILNQGYYEHQGVTLNKDNILEDFNLMRSFGFNGCRIHQKVEDPLLYYLADCYGFYLWSELPSCYEYSDEMKKEINRDLFLIIDQYYNSPSIITYVIFNESWGIPRIKFDVEMQEYVSGLKDKVKQYDNTRLAITNDGWHNLSNTDVLSLHEYQQDANEFYKAYADKDLVINTNIINCYGKAFAENHSYNNQPIIISEFGGIAICQQEGWGYGDKADNILILRERMRKLFESIYKLDYISGFCYTQLSDVYQETNGLVYENRNTKLSPEEVRYIVCGGNV